MIDTSHNPQWLTTSRKAHLISLFIRSKGFCIYGHSNCLHPSHHYEAFIEGLIADWISDDRECRRYLWQAEYKALNSLGEQPQSARGEFSAVGKSIFFDNQPEYYLIGLGISGLTFKPFAKVRIASSFVSLYVELGDSFKGISKAQRRKALRYGKLTGEVREAVNMAVRHYLSH